jgi:hypothetical protein
MYQTCVTWISSDGASKFAEPWYGQGVLVCLWIITFKGFDSSGGSAGKALAMLSCLLSAWIALCTYLLKLPIFYATGASQANVRTALAFWTRDRAMLTSVTLAPACMFYCGLIAYAMLLIATGTLAVRGLFAARDGSPSTTEAPNLRGCFASGS